jgi:hypothetical protein
VLGIGSTLPLVTALLLASGAPSTFQSTPLLPFVPAPHVVAVEADRDATLFEETNGLLASGAGETLFVGRTNQAFAALRRSVLHFTPPDIPGSGHGLVLESAVLVLHASPTQPGNPDPAALRVHALLAEWSEGPSVSPSGSGVSVQEGDVTWVHARYAAAPGDGGFWMHNGAQFAGIPLASATREGNEWRFSSPELTALVAGWIAEPDTNVGLIVIGNETTRQTTKAIASREHADAAVHPVLELTVRSGVRQRRSLR